MWARSNYLLVWHKQLWQVNHFYKSCSVVNNLHMYVQYIHVLLKLWLQSAIFAVTGKQKYMYWDFASRGIDAVKRFVITTSILEMTPTEIEVKLAKLMGNMTWYQIVKILYHSRILNIFFQMWRGTVEFIVTGFI